jgi:hypothetical protein
MPRVELPDLMMQAHGAFMRVMTDRLTGGQGVSTCVRKAPFSRGRCQTVSTALRGFYVSWHVSEAH